MQSYETSFDDRVVSMGDWILTIILMAIPVVNIIMLFVWGFGSSTPLSKKNFAKAQLIFMAIGIVLMIIFWGSIAAILAGGTQLQ